VPSLRLPDQEATSKKGKRNIMPQLLIAVSTWFHALATVILLGHYILLSLVYLPSLRQSLEEADMNRAVDGIESRVQIWIHLTLVVFIVTGIHLMLANTNYQGIGNFSGPWAIMMLAKHVVVAVFVVLGFYLDHGGRRKKLAEAQQLQTVLKAMAACGVIILLLTAVAQSV
jgi:uncharacterized membrane protein